MRNAFALESWLSFYTYSCRNGEKTGLIQSDLIETLIGGLYYVRLAPDVNRPENV